ncbi:MAG: hypothetical protein ACRDAI_06815 [Candidatus Rhabdochlamydia sp.]
MGHKILLFLLIGAHIGFVSILIGSKPSQQGKKSRPLIVKTISLPPSYPTTKKASLHKKTTPILKPAKSLIKKKSIPIKQARKRIPSPKQPHQEFDIPSSLLKQLEESIAKIEQKDDKQCKSSTIVAASLSSKEAVDLAQEDSVLSSYTASLIKELTKMLQLPEYGTVKVKMKIDPTGKIVELLVLQAESKVNKLYLEKRLPNIVLPRYNEQLMLNDEQTFTLTFCNAL